MAYHFTAASSSRVQFGIAPVNGYTFGALTFATFIKRATTADIQSFEFISDSAGTTERLKLIGLSTNAGVRLGRAGLNHNYAFSFDTSNWFLCVATCAGTGSVPRFHIHNGTSWTHADQTSGSATFGSTTIGATDQLFVSAPGPWGGDYMNGDIVCAGIKKSNTTDLGVETLSRTLFSSWMGFGFEWLVGFETISTQTNRANPGSGDETARTSVTLVADPPSWNWSPTAFVPTVGAYY